MTAVRFNRRGHMYAVTFPYNPEVVEMIKLVVPAYDRTWVPSARVWLVEEVYARELAATLRNMGHTVIGVEEPPKRTRDHADDPTFWAQALFKRVGPTRSSAVYRALSKCFHPDLAGDGDTELQRELNSAHAEITQRKEKSA